MAKETIRDIDIDKILSSASELNSILAAAGKIAAHCRHPRITTADIFLTLVDDLSGSAHQVLFDMEADITGLRKALSISIEREIGSYRQGCLTDGAKEVIRLAHGLADRFGQNQIFGEHLLLALYGYYGTRMGHRRIFLDKFGIRRESLYRGAFQSLQNRPK